jgi:hypothetical protein
VSQSDAAPRTSWISLLYYYMAALIGLIVIVVSLIIAANALIDAAFLDARQSTTFSSDGFIGDLPTFNEDRGR